MNRRAIFLLLGMCPRLVACSPSPASANVLPAGAVSCVASSAGAAGTGPLFCVETEGLTEAQAQGDQGACEAETEGGPTVWTFAYVPCPRAGALGGCRWTTDVSRGVTTTQWYYAGGIHLIAGVDGGETTPPCPTNAEAVSP